MESIQLGSRRPVYVWLNPGETQEQALARHHAQYPTTTNDPAREVTFITWRMPADPAGA